MFESYWEERQKRPSMWVERTTITKSATAAAGSGDIHAYRRFKRAATLARIDAEDEEIERAEHDDFQKLRMEKFQKANQITQKKKQKRQKEKEKKKEKKAQHKLEKQAKEYNQFPNDGTFIEKVKTLVEQKTDNLNTEQKN
ncbi:hypothetical protein pb186bvf_011000 [Paramecium bursaria]